MLDRIREKSIGIARTERNNDAQTLHSYRKIPPESLKTGMPESRQIVIEDLPCPVLNAHLLNEGSPIPMQEENRTVTLDLQSVPVDPIDTIVVLEMKR